MAITTNLPPNAQRNLEYFIPRGDLQHYKGGLEKLERRLQGFATIFPKANEGQYVIRYDGSLESRIVRHLDHLVPQMGNLIAAKAVSRQEIQNYFATRPNTVREELSEGVRTPLFWVAIAIFAVIMTILILAAIFLPPIGPLCIAGLWGILGLIATGGKSLEISHAFDQWAKPLKKILEKQNADNEPESPSLNSRSESVHSLSRTRSLSRVSESSEVDTPRADSPPVDPFSLAFYGR